MNGTYLFLHYFIKKKKKIYVPLWQWRSINEIYLFLKNKLGVKFRYNGLLLFFLIKKKKLLD